jgi:hypothetical protein
MLQATSNTLQEFAQLPDTARIWIYQAERFLTPEETTLIREKGALFATQWQSHGSSLRAEVAVLHNLFIILAVDEEVHEASGCSIDKSVRFLKDMETLTNINFFNRMIISYLDSHNQVQLVLVRDLKTAIANGQIDQNTLIFNNLIESLAQLKKAWLIPASESWLASQF